VAGHADHLDGDLVTVEERFAEARAGLRHPDTDQTPAADAAWQLAILEEQFIRALSALRQARDLSEGRRGHVTTAIHRLTSVTVSQIEGEGS